MGATPILKIEFLPGDLIEDACKKALEISKKFGMIVVFDFNGVRVSTVWGSVEEMVEHYMNEIKWRAKRD